MGHSGGTLTLTFKDCAMLRFALIFACALAASSVAAQPPSAVKTAELSGRLFDAGVQARDPLLMIAAAKLRKSLNLAATDRAPEDGTAATEAPLNWQDMLAATEPLVAEDETLLGLIDDIRAETTKGVATGPVYNIGQIANGKTDTYPNVDFIGGEYAEIYVEAKGATDLNMTVTDAQGRVVCTDTDKSHIAYCGWRPDQTAPFRIMVTNRGPNGVTYALMTN